MPELDGVILMLAIIVLLIERTLANGIGGRFRTPRLAMLDAALAPLSFLAFMTLATRFIQTAFADL